MKSLAGKILALVSLSYSGICGAQASDGASENPGKSSPLGATAYTCTSAGLTRTVEISYDTPGAKVPCKVNYTKDTESPGATQALYSAISEAGYCESKITAFIEKLSASDWSCSPKK